jgi:hypothetical protein
MRSEGDDTLKISWDLHVHHRFRLFPALLLTKSQVAPVAALNTKP